jgi:GT2 family glycosyltransferase
LSEPRVTVVIPTLAADSVLLDCLQSLEHQTLREFEVVVVDNSGKSSVRRAKAPGCARILENSQNVGFGAAINQGLRNSRSPFLATLNDDAVAHPGWLGALVQAIEARPDVGMCASQIRLAGEHRLDSAGMLICTDGSSKQRGHLLPPECFTQPEEVLFPSACAALYRRTMLEEIGAFDEDFFLYSEDVDLGLRARWAGWKCLYVPGAVVDHRYSYSAGRVSALKAYYVERNRLFVVAKNFPVSTLLCAPWVAMSRYLWHVVSIFENRGAAARFRQEGNSGLKLALFVLRAHCALLFAWRRLWKKRRAVQRAARISPAEFRALLRAHSISAREVASL